MAKDLIDEMVDRFLGWKLPKDFSPDCGISFDGRKDDKWNKNKTWPIGTNLLNGEQAREMIMHLFGESPLTVSTKSEEVVDLSKTTQFVKGERYNWKNQHERLIYLGNNWNGNGYWHQFSKVEEPSKIWCEVLTADLHMLEATKEA